MLSCFAAAVPVPPLILDTEILGASYGGRAAAEDGLSGLLAVGLIETRSPGTASGRPAVLVHPLVAETIRYQAAARLGEAAAAAAALLEAAVGHLDEANPQDMAQWAGVLPTVLPHLRAVLASARY